MSRIFDLINNVFRFVTPVSDFESWKNSIQILIPVSRKCSFSTSSEFSKFKFQTPLMTHKEFLESEKERSEIPRKEYPTRFPFISASLSSLLIVLTERVASGCAMPKRPAHWGRDLSRGNGARDREIEEEKR